MRRALRGSFFSWEFFVLPALAVLTVGLLLWVFTQLQAERGRRVARDVAGDSVERLQAKIAAFEREFTERARRFDAIEARQVEILRRLDGARK